MTDGDALLAAVLANPDEDTPRLVYADWLQEQGDDARAEFIRVQVELAGLPVVLRAKKIHCAVRVSAEFLDAVPPAPLPGPEEVRSEELRRRSDELSALHGDRWVPPGLAGRVMFRWERGFVAEVRACAAADWLAHADTLLAAHPVRKVVLSTALTEEECRRHGLRLGFAPWPVMEFDPTATPPFRRTFSESITLRENWPGVEFELPRDGGYRAPRDLLESIGQSLGLPPGASAEPG